MPDSPTVSVITTTYNAGEFVREAISSVLTQRGVDLEHVIVDDGSTDDTVAQVRAVGDSRVRLVVATRVGRGCALNLALAACRGPFVAIQDADDVSHPDRLVAEVGVLEQRAEVAGVGTGQFLFGPGRAPAWVCSYVPPRVKDVTGRLVFYNPLSHTSLLFRRAALEQVGGYDSRRSSLFDWDLYIRLGAAGFTLAKLSVPLVGKRIHQGQFFECPSPRRYAVDQLKLQWRALGLLGRSRLLSLTFPALLAYRWLPRSARLSARRRVERLRS